jgi:outer membrane lipoprotein-sorting protein
LLIAFIRKVRVFSGLIVVLLILATPGCVVRKVTHVHAAAQTAPARDANLAELVAKIDAWSAAIHTLNATVDFEPTAGSVYSGVIKEYHDVKGFVLLQRPSAIRILGQAPVVRTTIFDMVSDGEQFRLNLPTQHKFIIGKNSFQHSAKNALENLRPQHILQALIVPSIDPNTETTYREKADRRTEGKRYLVVGIVSLEGERHATLRRKEWFDRSDLDLSRTQLYDPDGTCTEDVHYSNYQDFSGVRYPTRIELSRPEEDYELAITIEKATFNSSIPPERFDLKKPEGAELIELSGLVQGEHPVGQ